jgi:thiol-disulfide isomerase/thioredoxin
MVLLAAVVIGCSSGGARPVPSSFPATPIAASDVPTTATLAPAASTSESAAALDAWLVDELVDGRSGSATSVSAWTNRVLVIEAMATWCPPCLEQGREIALARQTLAGSDVAFLSIDVDPREPADTLRAYADREGFPWTFLVGTQAFLRHLAARFGVTVLDPPATPVIVIDATGHAVLTEIGIKRAERIAGLVAGGGS